MGSDISKPGDFFYPDNPNRRARASQLRDDVQDYCNQVQDLKKHRDDVLRQIKPQLANFLRKHGYHSPEELDRAVQNTLKGSALADYRRYKQQIDGKDEFMSTIFQITSVISVSSGIFLGTLVILGIMTGGLAIAIIGGLGIALAVVGGMAYLLIGIADGAIERANMQKSIHDLSFERVKARAALEGMKAICNWVVNIKMWLEEPLISDNEAIMRQKIEGNFTTDFNKSKRRYVVESLTQLDRERGSWTDEDPDWKSGPEEIFPVGDTSSVGPAPVRSVSHFIADEVDALAKRLQAVGIPRDALRSKIHFGYSNAKESGTLDLEFVSSDEESCTGVDTNDKHKWIIKYESGLEKLLENPSAKSKFENLRFVLKNLDTGRILEGCKVVHLTNIIGGS